MKLADRLAHLGTETAFLVFSKAKDLEAQGKEMVHLEIGEPDFDTPENIINSAIEALRNHWTHYCPSAGLIELRETVAEDISQRRGIEVGPENIVITPGGKPIIIFSISTFFFCNKSFFACCRISPPNKFIGGEPINFPTNKLLGL